jgi:hypothetical protein
VLVCPAPIRFALSQLSDFCSPNHHYPPRRTSSCAATNMSEVKSQETPLSDLPQLHRFVTGHNVDGKAVVRTHDEFKWQPLDDNQIAFSVPYTTSSFPPDLNNDADVAAHEAVMKSGSLGLVNPRGTVFRCVDFRPNYACGMHRTQSVCIPLRIHLHHDKTSTYSSPYSSTMESF